MLFGKVIVLVIGCNWFVCLVVWFFFGVEDGVGKIVGIWFLIMVFVVIGFQYVVVNMFIILVVIFVGFFLWGDLIFNFILVFIGNVIGGVVFVGFIYFIVYLKKDQNK